MAQTSPQKTLLFSYDANGDVISVNYNGTEYFYLRNGQNDVVGLMDGSGTKMVEYTYDAWGKLISTTGTLATSLGADNPFRYRGYYYDTETGLYYLMSRYYDPEVCRFISADVYMTTGQGVLGGNMWAYCGNNPVVRYEVQGEFWNIIIGAAAGAIISGAISVISQGIENGWDNINWGSVGVAAATGAISGGLAATGVGVVGQTIANGVIGAVSAGVDTYVSSGGKATASEYLTNIAVGGVLGAVSGRIGGSGAGNKHLSASASRALKRVGSAVSNVGKSGIKTAAKEVAKAGRYYYSQVAKQALQNASKAVRSIVKASIPNSAYSILRACMQ